MCGDVPWSFAQEWFESVRYTNLEQVVMAGNVLSYVSQRYNSVLVIFSCEVVLR